MTLFKKKVINTIMTDAEKDKWIRFWLWREKIAWTIVVSFQAFFVFFLLSFVRYYSWTVVQKWYLANFQAIIHRLFSAPLLRMSWIFSFMVCSSYTGCCDSCIVGMGALVTFQTPLEKPPLYDSKAKDEFEEEEGMSETNWRLEGPTFLEKAHLNTEARRQDSLSAFAFTLSAFDLWIASINTRLFL